MELWTDFCSWLLFGNEFSFSTSFLCISICFSSHWPEMKMWTPLDLPLSSALCLSFVWNPAHTLWAASKIRLRQGRAPYQAVKVSSKTSNRQLSICTTCQCTKVGHLDSRGLQITFSCLKAETSISASLGGGLVVVGAAAGGQLGDPWEQPAGVSWGLEALWRPAPSWCSHLIHPPPLRGHRDSTRLVLWSGSDRTMTEVQLPEKDSLLRWTIP